MITKHHPPLIVLALLSISAGLAPGAARAGQDSSDRLAAMAMKAAGTDQGLCLVVGNADWKLAVALAKAGRMYVQGSTRSTVGVDAARRALVAAGVADRASVVARETEHLPYADNLINLVVSTEWGREPLAVEEVLRVLAPGGVAVLGSDANAGAIAGLDAKLKAGGASEVKALSRPGWISCIKAPNPGFDAWTHNLGGPDLSSVNSDKAAGPWAEVRWIGGPRWGALRSIYRGRVTAGGRIYYKETRAAVGGGTVIWLVSRDAWNGFEYWRLQVGPRPKYGNVDNTLTCDETRVYSVENNRTLTARDGRSGQKVREYAPGFVPTVATCADSVLLACNLRISPAVATRVAALDKESGKVLWTRPGITHPPAENGTAFVLTSTEIEGVDLATGASRWKAKVKSAPGNPRVFCKAGVVYVQHKPTWTPPTHLAAFDAKKGDLLWKKEKPGGSYGTMPCPDGLWMLDMRKGANAVALNPRTGAEKQKLQVKGLGKCFPPTGSANYLLYCSSSYLDLKSGAVLTQGTVRSPCALGHVPANGLTYFLPHHCDCKVALRGMLAMSPAGKRKWLPDAARESGPKLFVSGAAPAALAEKPDDWPMYRRDAARSNFTPGRLPVGLKRLWSEKLGGSRLTQAVSAYGLVCTTEPRTHRVFARDAASGTELWGFVADGRTEWPPALHKGLCIFSTAAGSVYALDARTGKQVWRLRAAPAEKYIAEAGRFASAWPVIGGVMPMNGEIFFASGRARNVDGGMWIFAADAATGKVRWRVRGGSSGDMFLSNGKELMLTKAFYKIASGARVGGATKKKRTGLLHTTHYYSAVSVLDYMACVEPLLSSQKHIELTDGRITGEALAFSDKLGVAAWRYRFGVPKEMMKKDRKNQRFIYAAAEGKTRWLLDKDITQQMVGVVLAGETAYLAGVPTSLDPKDKSELWVLSGADGKKLQTIGLESRPVYDGLSAAGGRLYLATEDGRLASFGAE